MKFLIILVFTLIPPRFNAAGRGHNPLEELKQSREYREGYKKGVAEADRQIKEGVVTLYTFGLQMSLEHLDKHTGLPVDPIAGCVVDGEIMGRADGHNGAVTEHIERHGLPPNSFRRWSRDLFDLKGFFERESRTTPPTPLKAGGPILKSPDGRFTLRPVRVDLKDDEGKPSRPHLGFVLGGETLNPTTETILWDQGETDLLWGPPGSRFVVFRCRDPRIEDLEVHFLAFDLQRGRWLRWESARR